MELVFFYGYMFCQNSSLISLSVSSFGLYIWIFFSLVFLDEKINNLNLIGLIFISIGLIILSLGMYNSER